MNTEQILTGILVVLIILAGYQTIQLKELSSKINGGTNAASTGSAGETYEQMIERMHGAGPSAAASAPAASSSPASTSSAGAGMVGGC